MQTPLRAQSTARPRSVPGVAGADRSAGLTSGPGPVTLGELDPLVVAAAHLDPGDTEAADRLRVEAHRVTSRLSASGFLPAHLVVGTDDPAVSVIRILAATSRAVIPALPPTGQAGACRQAG